MGRKGIQLQLNNNKKKVTQKKKRKKKKWILKQSKNRCMAPNTNIYAHGEKNTYVKYIENQDKFHGIIS